MTGAKTDARTAAVTDPATGATAASRVRSHFALAVVCIGTLVAPLDSAVNIALPSITRAFDAGIADVRWIVIAYVLTYSCLLLIFGKLGDLLGYRPIFQTGLLVSAAGFMACALAPSFGVLLLGRGLQGIGIALTLSCAPALATTLFPESERTRVLGIYAAMLAAGAALGPIAGGILVERFGWNAVFWARTPLALTALALTVFMATPAPVPRPKSKGGIDSWGGLLLIGWLAPLLLGFAASAADVGPLLPAGLTAAAVLVFATFIRHERRHPEPIIRPSLFRNVDFTVMNVLSIIVNFAAFSIMLLVPYYLARTRGLDAVSGGVVLALANIGTVFGSWFAGRMAHRMAVGRLAMAGIALSFVGLAGIALLGRAESIWPVAVALLIQGVGVGLFQVAYADLVIAGLPLEDRGVAGSLSMVTRTMGVVAGATAHAAVLRSFEHAAIAKGLVPADAFLAGFEAAFGVAAVSALLALLLGLARPKLWRRPASAGLSRENAA